MEPTGSALTFGILDDSPSAMDLNMPFIANMDSMKNILDSINKKTKWAQDWIRKEEVLARSATASINEDHFISRVDRFYYSFQAESKTLLRFQPMEKMDLPSPIFNSMAAL